MSLSEFERPPCVPRGLYRLAIILTLLLLVLTGAVLVYEHSLPSPRWFETRQATFVAGSIGTEFIPLPVLEVLPVLDPERFPPTETNPETGAMTGGWIAKYGFLERRKDERTFPETQPELANLLREDSALAALPVGFTLSYYRPSSPDPSPVRFVGLACAGCHSTRLPDHGPSGRLVYGAGNSGLDLIGFFRAFSGIVLAKKPKPSLPSARTRPVSVTEAADLDAKDKEYVLSMASITKARRSKGLPALSYAEWGMTYIWVTGIQAAFEKTTMKYDLPPDPAQLRDPRYNPNGPGRTGPFITLDNSVLNLPAIHNQGYSKIPAVFREGNREWAQFDGSVKLPNTRSGLAAMTAGATVDNLGGLGIARNIIGSADYTVEELVGPTFADIFGEGTASPPVEDKGDDVEAVRLSEDQRKGRAVYRQHCASCHGQPDSSNPKRWQPDITDPKRWEAEKARFPEFGKVLPAINPFSFPESARLEAWVTFPDEAHWKHQATDPQRVAFRDGNIMPYTLFTYFDRGHPEKITGEYYPLDHPLATPRALIRNSGGYINGPLDSLFARAPYLHNGSVPNLAQLINLEKRPAKFLRGKAPFDKEKVGVIAPDPAASTPTEDLFWTFDTSLDGNWNTGHNYPWDFDDSNQERVTQLRQLLEYLKTL